MKGVYINAAAIRGTDPNHSGVNKKINSQVDVLRHYFDVELEIHDTAVLKNRFREKVIRRLPYTPISIHWKYSEKYDQYDFIYFRKNDLDYSVFRFFCAIKKHNPQCKILLEIPTYPYEEEIIANGIIKELPFYLKDLSTRRRLKQCVDRIVTFSDDDAIFGIPTIKTINGIDFSTIPLRHQNVSNETIHACAVAYFNFWHGYDRFLTGLGEYYKNGGKRNIIFHLVGNGLSMPEFKTIIEKYDLYDHVVFHGLLSGEKLDQVYTQVNLGIGTMGLHRLNILKNSTLKSREYAARGLPIVGGKIDFWPSEYKYQLIVPNDDSPINIDRVVDFFDSIYSMQSPEEVAKTIREDAYMRCDMEKVMLPIINYLQDTKQELER